MSKPAMAATRLLLSLLLLLAMSTVRGGAAAAAGGSLSWCICRPDASEEALQKTLDYACGSGADCAPLHAGARCHSPNTLVAHCSYAANSYFHRKSKANKDATCDFGGAATISEIDPSSKNCTYTGTPAASATDDGATASPPAASTAVPWCVCKPGLSDKLLQGTLDYACGHGADCEPLRPGGHCHDPDTLLAHCSYAANSYLQSKKDAACDFNGTAALSSMDPSSGTCNYPATDQAMSPAMGDAPSLGETMLSLCSFVAIVLAAFLLLACLVHCACRSSRRANVSGVAAVEEETGTVAEEGSTVASTSALCPEAWTNQGPQRIRSSTRANILGGTAMEGETGTAEAAKEPFSSTCDICFEDLTNQGPHRRSCTPCGHSFGRSCLESWLRHRGGSSAKCPKCKRSFQLKDIINLY